MCGQPNPNPLVEAHKLRSRAYAAHAKAAAHEAIDASLEVFATHCTPAQRHRIQQMRAELIRMALEV